jgi:(p)ppGpp synthase/HD superfamily hydrolase
MFNMNTSELLEKAISIAVDAHRGQKDKSGKPYILHPISVMSKVRSETDKIAAILHDVVEDTHWTFEDLKKEGFPPEILDALDCVTKRESEPYEDFVKRSASNPIARRVKLADLEDNMDVRRILAATDKDLARLAKYRRAWALLTGE